MKTQKGNLLVLALIPVVLATLAIIVGVTSYIKYYNYGNQSEMTIKAEYSNLENIRAQYGLKIAEAAQIPKMQTEDLTKLFAGTLAARYGSDGSKAAMQWIQEQNPTLDQSTYTRIQVMIEAGRDQFQNAQTKFVDVKRVYETNLGYLWSGFWLRAAGYPKINMADYVIISSSETKEIFRTKEDNGVKLGN